MNLGDPLRDVAPGVRGALLRTLARLERPVTRRQLAAASGVTAGHASGIVNELVWTGIVNETRAGSASMVTLNRAHLAAAPIIALAGARGELISRLRDHLSGWVDLRGAWLFGSVARGDATLESDVDVLLIADDLEQPGLHERISELAMTVKSWTGNELQLVEHSPTSWRLLKESRNPLIDELRREGIWLAGDTKTQLARR